MPSRSQIVHWDISHLEQASSHWTSSTTRWEDHFGALDRGTRSPGGTAWEGEAADAARERSFADLVKVRGIRDTVCDAASVAQRGANELYCAKCSALDAVAEAEEAGFIVGEDLSVIIRQSGGGLLAIPAQRMALAQQYATTIAARAGELVALDKSIANAITAALAPLAEVRFADAAAAGARPHGTNGVQLVDNHVVKEAPPIPDPGTPVDPVGTGAGPSAADIRGVTDKLPQGTSPEIREVRTPQDLENLWKWMRQNGVGILNGYDDPAKGTSVTLPDGTRVGRRIAAGSTRQPALDINIPGEKDQIKIHINSRGGVPEIPLGARPPVIEAPPRLPVPVEPPPVRGGGFGGVIPDGALPRRVELPQAGNPDLPVIGDGIPDHPDA